MNRNRNLDEILVKAANSNLTATAVEFVPRAFHSQTRNFDSSKSFLLYITNIRV